MESASGMLPKDEYDFINRSKGEEGEGRGGLRREREEERQSNTAGGGNEAARWRERKRAMGRRR
jgi:hypothetical protein